ncbi:MAG: endoglucanase [Proteobacteria bacterium]|nr:endoglucanase [Pseudomonadota bacterium]
MSRFAHSLMLTAAALAAAPTPVGAEGAVHAPAPKPSGPAKGSVRIFPPKVAAEPAARPALDVRVATTRDFTRLEFHWLRQTPMGARLDGRQLILSFPRLAEPDLTRLRINPPPRVETAELRRSARGIELAVTLAEGVEVRSGAADGVAYVNLFDAKPASQGSSAQAGAVPAGGVVPVGVSSKGSATALAFPFAGPVGAAVFRRGDAVWIVFDAEAALDVSKLGRFRPTPVRGPGYTAVRLSVAPDLGAVVGADGGVWTVTLQPEAPRPPGVPILGERDAGPLALSAMMAGATAVRWISDPVVGDRIGAVTALAPAKGVPIRREFVELALLPSAHGMAVEPRTDDLALEAAPDLVRIGRPRGLALSGGEVRTAAPIELPQPASMPAVIDYAWGKLGEGGYLPRYDALLRAAAAEASDNKAVAARMGLARFLIGSELTHEGLGVLEALRRQQPAVMNDPDFRGLRGAGRASIGRTKEAGADFMSPVLAQDASSALWRGLLAATEGDHARAVGQLNEGAPALNLFPTKLRARFIRAQAESALAMGDAAGAATALTKAVDITGPEGLALALTRGKLLELGGDNANALKIYQAVANAGQGAVAAEAELRLTKLRNATGALDAAGAAQAYNALRWKWRGDEVELEVLRTLGDLYLRAGRNREALTVLHAATPRLPGSPTGVAIQNEMAAVFRRLFLDGEADGMEPIQALALFSDFRDLTPVGADGDAMTRRMAQRLVAVDLLPQAAELLQHQAMERLDGVARAQVATDLALIHLMDRNPEAALGAIAQSRTTVLPTALNLERRMVQARALLALGRLDHAMEILGDDRSNDAQAVRAEIHWSQGAWPLAAAALERSLAGGPSTGLSAGQESRLLKAAVAYSLAGDDAGLKRLRARFGGAVASARNPDALRIALAGLGEDGANAADLTRVVSEADAFAGWVGEAKRRFRARPVAAAARPKQAAAPAAPKQG